MCRTPKTKQEPNNFLIAANNGQSAWRQTVVGHPVQNKAIPASCEWTDSAGAFAVLGKRKLPSDHSSAWASRVAHARYLP